MATCAAIPIPISTPSPPMSFPKRPSHVSISATTKLSERQFLLKSDGLVEKWRLGVSSFSPFMKMKKGRSREEVKEELLMAIEPLDRGAAATPEDQERVDQIASELEALNTIKEPLKSDYLNGKWELIYTTSTSILKTQMAQSVLTTGGPEVTGTPVASPGLIKLPD